jgi:hypothetical protein
MGAYRSGRWNEHTPAMTVEQCQQFSTSHIRSYLKRQPYPQQVATAVIVEPDGLNQRVKVEAVPRYFGGFQFYFLCPSCDRRVSKLYRRPDRALFACRHCHELTYTSSQTSDKTPLMYRLLALRYAAMEATDAKERRKLERKLDRLIDSIDEVPGWSEVGQK